MQYVLLVVLILIVITYIVYLNIKKKFSLFLSEYFGVSSFKKALELTDAINENTPKSLSGMETVALPLIREDFPNLNINELKSMSEKTIIDYLGMLEKKEVKNVPLVSDKVMAYIISQVEDFSDTDNIHFDSIKVHRTVLSKYENKNGIATMYFVTGLEYCYRKNDEPQKKVQDRFKTEFIYIIDADKVKGNVKAIGLNCPNCGAPIKSIGHKTCDYCGAGVIDIVKRNWILNSISQY